MNPLAVGETDKIQSFLDCTIEYLTKLKAIFAHEEVTVKPIGPNNIIKLPIKKANGKAMQRIIRLTQATILEAMDNKSEYVNCSEFAKNNGIPLYTARKIFKALQNVNAIGSGCKSHGYYLFSKQTKKSLIEKVKAVSKELIGE